MTPNEGGEAAVETDTTQEAPEINVENEARKMGWVPEDEFKGDKRPAKFLSAEEYYRRGEEVIPIIRARNKDLEKSVEDLKKTNERMSRMFEGNLARERQRAEREIAELRQAKVEAIRAADPGQVERIEERIEELKDSARTDEKPAAERTAQEWDAHNESVQQSWISTQDWWGVDDDMTNYAIGVSNRIKTPDLSIEDNIKQVEVALRKKFPEHFGGKRAANGHAAVDAGGDYNGGGPSSGDDPLSHLPRIEQSLAREQARKDIKAGTHKNMKEWAKDYLN